MAWVYLVIAGVFEWGWPVGLKLGMTETGLRWSWIAFAMVCMALSGVLLMVAQIPLFGILTFSAEVLYPSYGFVFFHSL